MRGGVLHSSFGSGQDGRRREEEDQECSLLTHIALHVIEIASGQATV